MRGSEYRKIVVGVGALALVSSLALAGTASASHVTCGSTITVDTVLDSNVGPCGPAPANGAAIKIEGQAGTSTDPVTLDLGGYEVIGCTDPLNACNTAGVPATAAYVTGEGPGILVNNSTNVEVKGGTVRDFDSGVVVHGGGNNTLTGLTVKDNIGTALTSSSYGEGIGIYLSNDNRVLKNTVEHNGPFAGIGLYQFTPDNTGLSTPNTTADRNKIGERVSSLDLCPSGPSPNPNLGNKVVNNNVTPNGTTYQDDGIRIEPQANNNVVECNEVTGSSLEGIAVFADAKDNTVQYNVVRANGNQPLLTQRKGDGIRVFLRAERTLVKENKVCGNYGSGISVDSTATYPATAPTDQRSTIQSNQSGFGAECAPNALGPDLPTRRAYDLLEGGHAAATESCRHTWSGNTPSDPLLAFPFCTDTN